MYCIYLQETEREEGGGAQQMRERGKERNREGNRQRKPEKKRASKASP